MNEDRDNKLPLGTARSSDNATSEGCRSFMQLIIGEGYTLVASHVIQGNMLARRLNQLVQKMWPGLPGSLSVDDREPS
jgi:hypothetical protein